MPPILLILCLRSFNVLFPVLECLSLVFEYHLHHRYSWAFANFHRKVSVGPLSSGFIMWGTHIFRQIGMCCSNGSLFLQEILTHGSRFLPKKSLNMGPIFWLSPNFRFSHGENPENCKICEKWAYFSRKILNNGYPFLSKWPLKIGRDIEAQVAPPIQTKSEYPSLSFW